jgi:hypothetical protein
MPHNDSNQSRIKIKKTPLHLVAHNVMKRSKTALIHWVAVWAIDMWIRGRISVRKEKTLSLFEKSQIILAMSLGYADFWAIQMLNSKASHSFKMNINLYKDTKAYVFDTYLIRK